MVNLKYHPYRGGKAVMATALKYPSIVSQLVVVDMPPVQLPLAHSFAKYAEGMRYVEQARPSRLAEANKILAEFEPNEGIRQFLLTNLRRDTDNQLRFRVPYDLLINSLSDIASFNVKGAYKEPTMFITGGNSPYHQPFVDNKDTIRSMFPDSRLETVDGAGHWGKCRLSTRIWMIADMDRCYYQCMPISQKHSSTW